MSFLFGSSKTNASQGATIYAGLRVQTSVLGRVIPVVFGTNRVTPNLVWYGDFIGVPVKAGGKGGAAGGKGPAGVVVNYAASWLLGLCEGPVAGIGTVWASKGAFADPGSALASYTAAGTYPQDAWSHLTDAHPDQAFCYPGIALVGWASAFLGNTDTLPNYSFLVHGLCDGAGSPAQSNANPANIISTILCDGRIGLGISSGLVDVTDYANYCLASGILLSPLYDSQQDVATIIQELLIITNSDLILHDGSIIRVMSYGDQDLSGNGVSWTANVTPQYDLTIDDLISEAGQEPITIQRKDHADAFNWQPIEYVDGNNNFDPDSTEAHLQGEIDLYGLRMAQGLRANGVTNDALATVVAGLVVKRKCYYRNTYQFKLGMRHCLLECMDVVTLTWAALGLDRTPVRIKTITEDEEETLSITAEDVLIGAASAASHTSTPKDGYSVNHNIAPGDTNTPVIMTGPGALTPNGREMWIAASGGENWGGCEVWLSTDDTTYAYIGRINAPARYGELQYGLAYHADPDNDSTLYADLTISKGSLLSGTQADEDNLITCCYVGDELISYRDASLSSAYHYSLTHLRRGCYSSTITSHLAGAPFVRLDGDIFRWVIPTTLPKGRTVYLKFLSFNTFGVSTQSAADVSPYTYTIGQGCSYPSDVASLTASQNGSMVVFSWPEVTDLDLDGYEIRYNPSGHAVWADGSIVTATERGTHLVTARVPPGSWTFLIAAKNKNGAYSQNPARSDLTVINANFLVAGGTSQAPTWPGVLTNFVLHYTGILIPKCQGTADGDAWDTFDVFVKTPYASASYEAQELTLTADRSVRAFGVITSYLGPGEEGVADPQLRLKHHASGGSYGDYLPWTIGDIVADAVTMELVATPDNGVMYIADFVPTLDGASFTQQASGVSVASGGIDVTYPTPFSALPFLTVTPVGTTAVIADPTSETVTGFHVRLYDGSGNPVAGTITWQAIGV